GCANIVTAKPTRGELRDEAIRNMGDIGNLGRLLFGRGALCLMARIWRTSIRGNVDLFRVSTPGDATACGARCRRSSQRAFWPRWRDVSGRVCVLRLRDLSV